MRGVSSTPSSGHSCADNERLERELGQEKRNREEAEKARDVELTARKLAEGALQQEKFIQEKAAAAVAALVLEKQNLQNEINHISLLLPAGQGSLFKACTFSSFFLIALLWLGSSAIRALRLSPLNMTYSSK